MSWFKKKENIQKPEEKMADVSISNHIDVRTEILSKARIVLNEYKRICSFFNNNILNDILTQSEFIYDVFEQNDKLNIKKLEQYNYYYTENLIELLEKLKITREENIIILYNKEKLLKSKLDILNRNKIDFKTLENERKKWSNYISDLLCKSYKELCNTKSLTYAIDTSYKLTNIDKNFILQQSTDNVYNISNIDFDSLNEYQSEDYYNSTYFTIHKKLLGKLNKNVFNIEFKYNIKSENNRYLYVFIIKNTDEYFIFLPNKCVFKLVNSTDILYHIINNKSSWYINANILEESLNAYDKCNTELIKQKSIYEPELLDIFNKYLTKVNDIELLNSLQEIDINRRHLETILGLTRFDI